MDSWMARIALVASGGAVGSVARYGLDAWIRHLGPATASRFPLGILLVNTLGCFAFGWVVGLAGGLGAVPPERRLFLLTGVLGGFTTFSTFGHDTVRLLATGATGSAMLNAIGSVVLGIGAVLAGLGCGRLTAG